MKRLALTALLTLLALHAVAADDNGRRRGQENRQGDPIVLAQNGGGMSLDQAVTMVEKRFKAKVVRTEVRQDGERKIYVLRLLNDESRVWSVRVDASTGAIL
jgi:uncharacterized membrane protein YkoI